MILTNLLTLFSTTAIVVIASLMLAKFHRLFRLFVMLVSVALFASTSSLPALAAPNIAALGASE
ncbi:MAG: hypothetical protein BRC34_10260 [Cyanobacteria bacterium QH_1_48_107]|nr:MAG: hypothetical protein BRC34_10260 [Cyanobacteria bacterium QH_1_48_107]